MVRNRGLVNLIREDENGPFPRVESLDERGSHGYVATSEACRSEASRRPKSRLQILGILGALERDGVLIAVDPGRVGIGFFESEIGE